MYPCPPQNATIRGALQNQSQIPTIWLRSRNGMCWLPI
jgi:hypothetical protein